MKVLVSGVQRIVGTSKAGSAFDMCNVLSLVPVEAMNNGKIAISGHGYKLMEIALDPQVLPQFAGLNFPLVLDLNVEPRPRNGKVESVVVGLLADPKKAA